jgi:hypothetical protein
LAGFLPEGIYGTVFCRMTLRLSDLFTLESISHVTFCTLAEFLPEGIYGTVFCRMALRLSDLQKPLKPESGLACLLPLNFPAAHLHPDLSS